VLAAFVNLSAVADRVRHEPHVVIVCAGKLGRFALEDAACAGMLVERMVGDGAVAGGPAARLARDIAPRSAAEVRGIVEGSSHGRYLRRLGSAFARDVSCCAALDSVGAAFEV
jgi:2-phosphosulfolactate phosphatase